MPAVSGQKAIGTLVAPTSPEMMFEGVASMKTKLFSVLTGCLLLGGCAAIETGLGVGNTPSGPYRAIGYSSTSIQPGRNAAQKQLMAIRAAKAAAMRELAEKIYGADVGAQSSVGEGRIYNDVLRMNVEGLVRGARVVSIQPIRVDVYEAVLEVDPAEVAAMRSRPPRSTYR